MTSTVDLLDTVTYDLTRPINPDGTGLGPRPATVVFAGRGQQLLEGERTLLIKFIYQ